MTFSKYKLTNRIFAKVCINFTGIDLTLFLMFMNWDILYILAHVYHVTTGNLDLMLKTNNYYVTVK